MRNKEKWACILRQILPRSLNNKILNCPHADGGKPVKRQINKRAMEEKEATERAVRLILYPTTKWWKSGSKEPYRHNPNLVVPVVGARLSP